MGPRMVSVTLAREHFYGEHRDISWYKKRISSFVDLFEAGVLPLRT